MAGGCLGPTVSLTWGSAELVYKGQGDLCGFADGTKPLKPGQVE